MQTEHLHRQNSEAPHTQRAPAPLTVRHTEGIKHKGSILLDKLIFSIVLKKKFAFFHTDVYGHSKGRLKGCHEN